jgi:hypothetical protein
MRVLNKLYHFQWPKAGKPGGSLNGFVTDLMRERTPQSGWGVGVFVRLGQQTKDRLCALVGLRKHRCASLLQDI